MLAINSTNITG